MEYENNRFLSDSSVSNKTLGGIQMNVSDCIKMRRSIENINLIILIILLLILLFLLLPILRLGKTHRSLVILQLKTPLFSKRSLMIIPLFTILILSVKFLCWLLLLLSKADPVLNVTDPTAQKKGTDGRCLTLVIPASLLSCCKRTGTWYCDHGHLVKKKYQNF